MPDPREALAHYTRAVEAGDDQALYELMTDSAQRRYGRAGARRLLEDARPELLAQAKAVENATSEVEAQAELRFADGETVHLSLEQGSFRVDAAGTLPARARTPAEALDELRRALSRRSYPALSRVLSSEAAVSMEDSLRSLVEGLKDPRTLDVRFSGERATVRVPGGHVVKLRREGGVWRVEDFE
jgi:hypothetical protein